jgi:hypothetical protein
MIKELRDWFNGQFSEEKYQQFLHQLSESYHCTPLFRVAESPLFIPDLLKFRLLEACSEITDVILRPDIKEITQGALYDPSLIVPKEDDHTTFLQMDFGIGLDENGDPFPHLIEVQGFPSVYFFQYAVSGLFKSFYGLPEHLTPFIGGINRDDYVSMMRDIIVGDTSAEQVVLLEIEPEKQTTYIDMHVTAAVLGIAVVCITKVIKEGKKLFYKNNAGELIQIKKIYNRVIFDELDQRPDLKIAFRFSDDLDIRWVGHPNWFFRISKYLMPFLNSKYVPETRFLSDISEYPSDLENYVLKPLFSFAGSGVIIDVTKEVLDSIIDRKNFILQRKVTYEPILRSPDDHVKAEIRMLMLWPDDAPKPFVVTNLVRLSKGKMIGVKYNKDKTWVGGSVGFFES